MESKDVDRKIQELQTYCQLQVKGLFKNTLDLIELVLGGKKKPGFGTLRSAILRQGNDALRNMDKQFEETRKEINGQ